MNGQILQIVKPIEQRRPVAVWARENPTASNPLKKPGPQGLHRVLIYDNDLNTYQEVIDICMLALGVGIKTALQIALAVDYNGEAEVAHAPKDEAERIAGVIRGIGIEVRVLPI